LANFFLGLHHQATSAKRDANQDFNLEFLNGIHFNEWHFLYNGIKI
jgi:hypothetical protein